VDRVDIWLFVSAAISWVGIWAKEAAASALRAYVVICVICDVVNAADCVLVRK
jgi:hypothetical protein